jgi:hypothetical protein
MSELFSIWNSPRSTIRSVLDKGSIFSFFPLAAIWGVWKNLSQILRHEVPGDEFGVPAIIAINVVFGVVFGIVSCFVFAVLVRGVGKIFASRATTREVSLVVAWSAVPHIPSLVALLLLIVATGEALVFGSVRSSNELSPIVGIAALLYMLVAMVLGIWSIVIAVIGLSEAGGISVGRSLAVYLVSGAIVVATILGVIIASVELLPG